MCKGGETGAAWGQFSYLLTLQTLIVVADKMVQFLTVSLAFWLTQMEYGDFQSIPHLLAVLITIPYLLLASTAGWLSDRFSKVSVIRWACFLQVLGLASVLACLHQKHVWGVVGCFILLTIQATLMNPAKKGIIKELIGKGKLGSASGVFEVAIVLAVCLGQVIAGYWFSSGLTSGLDGWGAMTFPVTVLLGFSIIPLVLSFLLRHTGEVRSLQKRPALFFNSQLSLIWKDPGIRYCSLGKSFFLGYAGILGLWQIIIAGDISEETGRAYGSLLSTIILVSTTGVILGGLMTSFSSREKIRLDLLPMACVLMSVGVTLLYFSSAGGILLYLSFAIAGFGGAMFLVPVNAQLLNLAPAQERGRILAGASVLDCFFGLFAVGLQYVLSRCGVPLWGQCIVLLSLLLLLLIKIRTFLKQVRSIPLTS